MPSPPRLTAADAETLLVSAGFLFLERRGHHRAYGRGRTRVVVPFDGRPFLHPKVVRMIVESMERSRPVTSFGVDKTIVGLAEGAPGAMDAGAWVAADDDMAFAVDLTLPDAPAKPAPAAAVAPKAAPPAKAAAPKPAPRGDETITIPSSPAGQSTDKPEDVDLPRPPKPKGAWS